MVLRKWIVEKMMSINFNLPYTSRGITWIASKEISKETYRRLLHFNRRCKS